MEYDKSGFPKRIVDMLAEVIHDKWREDNKNEKTLPYYRLHDDIKEHNRVWARKLLRNLFQQ